jgi:hypothetical protein
MMATDAGNRAIADQPDGSGAAARKRLNAKRAQAPRLLIVSANAARFRGYEAIAAEYPDTELIIAGSMLLPAIKRTGAVYLLITKRMAEQDAMMILKKQWEQCRSAPLLLDSDRQRQGSGEQPRRRAERHAVCVGAEEVRDDEAYKTPGQRLAGFLRGRRRNGGGAGDV